MAQSSQRLDPFVIFVSFVIFVFPLNDLRPARGARQDSNNRSEIRRASL